MSPHADTQPFPDEQACKRFETIELEGVAVTLKKIFAVVSSGKVDDPGNAAIEAVGRAVGFKDAGRFIRPFRRLKELTPAYLT